MATRRAVPFADTRRGIGVISPAAYYSRVDHLNAGEVIRFHGQDWTVLEVLAVEGEHRCGRHRTAVRQASPAPGSAVPAPGRRSTGGAAMSELVADPTTAFITKGHKNLRLSICNVCCLGVFQTQECVEAKAKGGAR